MLISIIGYGFVGKSVHNSIKDCSQVYIFDKNDLLLDENIGLLDETAIAFICVPTPTIKGSQDISAITENLEILRRKDYKGLIIIKSSVLPNTIEFLIEEYKTLKIIHVPEFLNEHEPYKENKHHIVGTNNIRHANFYKSLFSDTHTFEIVSPKTAAMIKYVHNCYGATKVSFFNEIFDMCQNEHINYRTLINTLCWVNDNVGRQYTTPSSDGRGLGWGGACFPKDTVAFLKNNNLTVLNAAVEKNMDYRPKEMEAVIGNSKD